MDKIAYELGVRQALADLGLLGEQEKQAGLSPRQLQYLLGAGGGGLLGAGIGAASADNSGLGALVGGAAGAGLGALGGHFYPRLRAMLAKSHGAKGMGHPDLQVPYGSPYAAPRPSVGGHAGGPGPRAGSTYAAGSRPAVGGHADLSRLFAGG